ncbi:MAG: LapA family protein [Xanthomonadales bacterium]|nr:LapA family protein [Xanthomonadales bacterium]
MRLGAVVLVLVFAAFGAVFGALNADPVAFDLYFARFEMPRGAAVLVALMAGWIAGGLVVWALRVPRLQRELRNVRRQLRDARAGLAAGDDGKPSAGA